jgi:hypothetical protein
MVLQSCLNNIKLHGPNWIKVYIIQQATETDLGPKDNTLRMAIQVPLEFSVTWERPWKPQTIDQVGQDTQMLQWGVGFPPLSKTI